MVDILWCDTQTLLTVSDAFDFDLLVDTLQKLKDGKHVNVPIYDFNTHSRAKYTVHSSLLGVRFLCVGGGWRVEGGGWKMEGRGWSLEGEVIRMQYLVVIDLFLFVKVLRCAALCIIEDKISVVQLSHNYVHVHCIL